MTFSGSGSFLSLCKSHVLNAGSATSTFYVLSFLLAYMSPFLLIKELKILSLSVKLKSWFMIQH